jgi:soluble lytic murein transglycosylase-like protein
VLEGMRVRRWRLWVLLCAVPALGWTGQAGAGAFTEAAAGGQWCGAAVSRVTRASASSRNGGDLYRVSAKSRRIGAKLGATGYYSYYSRALKGYPHLRSKPMGRGSERTVAVNPESRKQFIPHVEKVARLYKLDPELVDAVISVESAYDPRAVSEKGALGLMQLMPGTARRFDVADALDPVANLHGGARYLRWLMDRYDNDLDLVLAAYNAGEGALTAYGDRIPPYEETRTYVARVRKVYDARQKGR